MVVTPMIQKGASVDRATVDNPREMQDADKEDALVIAIQRDGSIFLGSQKIDRSSITNLLKEKLSNRTDKTVFINSDKRAKYGDVIAAVDEIRAAGVDQLGLLTEKAQKKGAAPAGAAPAPSGGQ